jgi:hypothetical protein
MDMEAIASDHCHQWLWPLDHVVLDLHVRDEGLEPVLRRAHVASYEDGSRVHLKPGLALRAVSGHQGWYELGQQLRGWTEPARAQVYLPERPVGWFYEPEGTFEKANTDGQLTRSVRYGDGLTLDLQECRSGVASRPNGMLRLRTRCAEWTFPVPERGYLSEEDLRKEAERKAAAKKEAQRRTAELPEDATMVERLAAQRVEGAAEEMLCRSSSGAMGFRHVSDDGSVGVLGALMGDPPPRMAIPAGVPVHVGGRRVGATRRGFTVTWSDTRSAEGWPCTDLAGLSACYSCTPERQPVPGASGGTFDEPAPPITCEP